MVDRTLVLRIIAFNFFNGGGFGNWFEILILRFLGRRLRNVRGIYPRPTLEIGDLAVMMIYFMGLNLRHLLIGYCPLRPGVVIYRLLS